MNFYNISAENIQVFLLVFVRVTAMMSLLPIFSSQNIPVQLKAGLSFLLSLLVFPLVMTDYSGMALFTLPHFMLAVTREVFTGIVIGFAASFLFVVVQFAGLLIDRQMGFAMVQIVDPATQTEVTFSGQFLVVIFTMVFLLTNSHYFMILAVERSFQIIPLLGVQVPSGNLAAFLVGMTGDIFGLAIQLSAPVFVVLILSTLALAVVARTVPQINVFFVGMPLKIGLGVVTMALALPSLGLIFRSLTNRFIEDIWKLLHLLA